jgi:hypothetical protein
MQESKIAAIATEEAEPSAGGNSKYAASDFEIETLPENLSTEQQEAFQLRAIQKFQDFTDYLKIISNPKMDKDLKKHSQKLLKELFISDTITITDSSLIDPNETTISLSRFILFVKDHPKIVNFKTNNITFTIPLNKDSTDSYMGVMETLIATKHNQKKIKINVHLIEIDKQFGETTQKAIEIKLGNIY